MEKKSFLKLPIAIDLVRLRTDFGVIKKSDWQSSYWEETHGCVKTLLLRGGCSGNSSDYTATATSDHKLLKRMGYFRQLLSPQGPFGGATYAFIFKMKPFGVSTRHFDGAEVWHSNFRVHIPIFSNAGSMLLSEGRAQHFSPGEAWTFDNQKEHGAINGKEERSHLIIDVPPNPVINDLIGRSEFHSGKLCSKHWEKLNVLLWL